jgi:hypothetical protein
MLQALRESEEQLKDMPVRSSTEETLKIDARQRYGAMNQPTQSSARDSELPWGQALHPLATKLITL